MDYAETPENTDEIIDLIELSGRDILAIKSALWELAEHFGLVQSEAEDKDIMISYLAGYLRQSSIEGKPVDILDGLIEFCRNYLKKDVTHCRKLKRQIYSQN